jgi:hypothetical protein
MTHFRLTAVTALGTGHDHLWGDGYEVHADSYEEAAAKVLNLEPLPDSEPYARIVKAWRKDGWRWNEVAVPQESPGEEQ